MIDSTLFGVDLPAGTYTKGDVITLGIIDGPANVRSGRGAAILKRITCGQILDASGSTSLWKISVKNSDWVDPVISGAAPIRSPTALDEKSGCVQRGHDCNLTPNSSWQVTAECMVTDTTTVANSLFALIDIDYPAVSSIIDPDTLPGIPASIEIWQSCSMKAAGTLVGSSNQVVNVDFFKAGFEYALEKMETGGNSFSGFIGITNAAGMGGLKRIIPIASAIPNIRSKIEYASKLEKGPMDITFNLFSGSGTAYTGDANVVFDFVKRRM